MSGTRAQSFGIRLSLDGASAVEDGLRRVQATASGVSAAVVQLGENTGRSMQLIDRGSRAAADGLRTLGGNFSTLAPLVESTGGAVGRLVSGLGAGAGLLGTLGLVGGAVTAVVAVYQNWETVTRAVSSATDTLTGRVRAIRSELTATYELLNRLQGIAAQPQSVTALAEIGRIDTEAATIRQRIAQNERALADESGLTAARRDAARFGDVADQVARARELDPGFQPSGTIARRLADLEAAQRRAAELERVVQRAEGDTPAARDLRADRAALADLERARRRQQGIVAAAEENVGSVRNPPPAEDPARPARGGGGGAARTVNDALRDREALIQRNMTADERYAQGLARIAELNDRLIAQGDDPLPDDVVQREAARLMEDYERATRGASDATRDLAQESRDLERAGAAAAKTLAGAFEDLVFEGRSFDDVLRNVERSLLRIGNQLLLQPLFQQGADYLFGGQGKGGASGGGGGGGLIGGLVNSVLGSFGGAAGGAKGAIDALQAAGTIVSVYHDGGLVGAGGAPMRMVPASLFAGAPRFHSGGIVGPDEVPAILRRGEMVLTEAQQRAVAGSMGGVTVVNQIRADDAASFRRSSAQVSAELARATQRAVTRNR